MLKNHSSGIKTPGREKQRLQLMLDRSEAATTNKTTTFSVVNNNLDNLLNLLLLCSLLWSLKIYDYQFF